MRFGRWFHDDYVDRPTVRLLEATNNARGDLFTRLMRDFFTAMGYEDLRFNVQTAGREIDIHGKHRFESRLLVAECKAEREPIGGRDTNTFLGVVTRERDRAGDVPVAGYFISLGGFRETAIEQEKNTSPRSRLILLNGADVVRELERADILISAHDAIEQAGRRAQHAELDASVEEPELLGHAIGYVWAVCYSRGKEQTHVAFIHADGTQLAESIARDIVQADREAGGRLHELKLLVPPALHPDVLPHTAGRVISEASAPSPRSTEERTSDKAASDSYQKWVDEAYGYLKLDGLPVDVDLNAARLKLERLFVPLHVVISSVADRSALGESIMRFGELLASHHRVAVLARPGGGKTALLKRLAVAYTSPSRRAESDDDLPDREWLPLFLRCRDLRDRLDRSVVELLEAIPRDAGMTDREAAAFHGQLHVALRSGKALLLLDGLDEFTNDSMRTIFMARLQTFVVAHPQTAIVVTSRETYAGLFGDALGDGFVQARIAPFDFEDVERLCERWHVEVVGDSEKVRSDARRLAVTIWQNVRVRALAESPLTLTTLLVIRRWIGEIPTRRVHLYSEAVRVLIQTWNTEGFAPMDVEETLSQLSYVACTMTEARQQWVTEKALLALLRQARSELLELQFSVLSPEQFLERVEHRSGLLMQTGYVRLDDELQRSYQFQHLVFQDYLTALGLVNEWQPGREEPRSLVERLEPHLDDDKWREIIPLAVVLAGRRADQVLQRLIQRSLEPTNAIEPFDTRAFILRQCLLDEAQMGPDTLRAALRCTIRDHERPGAPPLDPLIDGKFGLILAEIAATTVPSLPS
jgi:hypothetical protein